MLGAIAAAGIGGAAGCTTGNGTETTTDGGEETDGGGSTSGQTTTQADVSASGTVKIGVMQPMSGDLQYYGMQGIWGFLSGLAYKTDTDPLTGVSEGTQTIEDGDVTWELVFRDTEFSADRAQTIATNLGDLAEEFDVSKPAVSKNLRRGERQMVERVVDALSDLDD